MDYGQRLQENRHSTSTADAEIITRQGVRLARWRDGKGKMRTSPVTTGKDGADRIRDESATYVARYRDGNGSSSKSRPDAETRPRLESVLADLERRAERGAIQILTAAEDRIADHLTTPIGEHVAAYSTHLEAVGTSPKHRYETRRRLDRVVKDCRFAHSPTSTAGPSRLGSSLKRSGRSQSDVGADPQYLSGVAQRLRKLVRRDRAG